MKSNGFRCLRVAALAMCAAGAVLPVAAQTQAHYSGSELREMMRKADTADRCRTLATWFRGEEAAFRAKAEAESADYERYKTTVRTKVPTRADNARSSADYYSGRADKMAALAALYEARLARLDPSYRPARATASAGASPALGQVRQPGQSSVQ
jgi:hypothetical protein